MTRSAAGLDILTHRECLKLLASVPVGRIAYTEGALPAVTPVNFVLDENDSAIVIRTGQGSKLSAATRQAVVAFEVDEFDVATRTGWSVLVVGRSSAVDHPDDVARLDLMPLRPWAKSNRDRYIRISIDQITGRWLPRGST
jgi:nitroimidazol reductase NimA-like FMN-containing flavoprotein (pyridoxamine 5'-phosphate oxidase superfamily)